MATRKQPQGKSHGVGTAVNLDALMQCATECATSLSDCLNKSIEGAKEHVQEIFDRIETSDLIDTLTEQVNQGSEQARVQYEQLVNALERAYNRGYTRAKGLLSRLSLGDEEGLDI